MVASPQKSCLTPEEYLKLENDSGTKHEYFAGKVFAMAGATDAHVTIALNTAIALRNHLRGSECRIYISDMKAKIEQKNRFFYPDVMVTCAQEDRQNQLYKEFPCLVIEVLLDSTEAFDRGDKFADYQALPSLKEYVLVNTRKQMMRRFGFSGIRLIVDQSGFLCNPWK